MNRRSFVFAAIATLVAVAGFRPKPSPPVGFTGVTTGVDIQSGMELFTITVHRADGTRENIGNYPLNPRQVLDLSRSPSEYVRILG